MKLHNRKGFINSAPEGEAKTTNKPRFTQWIYFIFLAFMIGYIIYLIAKPYFIITTNGIVDVENKYVYADRAGLVKTINTTPEQIIQQGSLLVTLSPEKQCLNTPDTRLEKLAYDIEVAKAKRLALTKEKEYLHSTITPSETLQRALEINSSLFVQENAQKLNKEKQEKLLEYEIETNSTQISAMNARLAKLTKENNETKPNAECLDKSIYAPSNGQVSKIHVDNATYVKRGDILMSYRELEPVVKVVMLADNELYQDLIKQPALTVTFPDQTESLAKIQHVESTASNTSLSVNEILSNETVSLRVILVPADNHSQALWKKYERMSVSIRGVR
ncbi:hypothetical protein [Thalassotalea profundi]|nr:hypothetical protein [Thalassotalea profundi]